MLKSGLDFKKKFQNFLHIKHHSLTNETKELYSIEAFDSNAKLIEQRPKRLLNSPLVGEIYRQILSVDFSPGLGISPIIGIYMTNRWWTRKIFVQLC